MARTVPIDDVFAAAVPAHINPLDEVGRARAIREFQELAVQFVVRQYIGRAVKPQLKIDPVDWCITDDPAEIEKFQPAHDCDACRAGNDQAAAFLRDNPGRFVALGNIHYTETWAEGVIAEGGTA